MLNLSPKEKEVLAVVQTRAEMPLEEIAAITGQKIHTVRYHLNNLIDKEVIGLPIPFVNVYRLGYAEYLLYFSLRADAQQSEEKMLEWFAKAAPVSWVVRYSGEYDFGVSICVKDLSDLSEFLDEMVEQTGVVFEKKAITTRLSFSYFGWRHYSEKDLDFEPLSIGGKCEQVEIDDVDRKILQHMARGESKSVSQLSRDSGIPNSTVERRKKRLEDSRVIEGYIHRVSEAVLGTDAHKFLIRTKGLSLEFRKEIESFCKEVSNVVILAGMMGDWDYEISVGCLPNQTPNLIVEALLGRFGSEIESIQTLAHLEYLKRHNYPFYDN